MPTYSVRFRHPSGADVGPFTFSGGSSIAVLKERLLQEWPADGPAAKERPGSLSEIRLISCGKFLDNSTTLQSLAKVIGQPDPDVTVTMHVIVRPPMSSKTAGKVSSNTAHQPKTCMCTIC